MKWVMKKCVEGYRKTKVIMICCRCFRREAMDTRIRKGLELCSGNQGMIRNNVCVKGVPL